MGILRQEGLTSNTILEKPRWLRAKPPGGERYLSINQLLRSRRLHTVCEEALCPNISECWNGGTVTFMLLGDTCTRGCRFCMVKHGRPQGVIDSQEPANVAAGVQELGVNYVVLTSVNRDDLLDGGAEHFATTIRYIKRASAETIVEALIPDFQGSVDALRILVDSRPDVISHNIETVERLTPVVRDRRASYQQSLAVLRNIKRIGQNVYTKSGLMVGLGETHDEIMECMRRLRCASVDILTIGQYLRPSTKHLPVEEYVAPEKFDALRQAAVSLGFLYVAAGPLVRSSYRAGEYFVESLVKVSTGTNAGQHPKSAGFGSPDKQSESGLQASHR